MFEDLQPAPADKILALIGLYRADPRPNKVDLGVGVYKDRDGKTPVMVADGTITDGETVAALMTSPISDGKRSAVMGASTSSPRARIISRSTLLRSWRTLPGQLCACSTASASSPMRRGLMPAWRATCSQ